MPPLPPLLRDQRQVDASHVKLLAIFHFVAAGLFLGALGFLVLHFAMMHLVFTDPKFTEQMKNAPPPEMFLTIMKVMYGLCGALLLLACVGNIISGVCLLRRRARVLSLIVAGFNCPALPLGTILGAFTFVVLLRESVRELYAAGRADP